MRLPFVQIKVGHFRWKIIDPSSIVPGESIKSILLLSADTDAHRLVVFFFAAARTGFGLSSARTENLSADHVSSMAHTL